MATRPLEPFAPGSEGWENFMERLEFHLLATDVVDLVKRKAVFLSSLGIENYALLKDLIAPRRPADVDFDDLVLALSKHFQPKPNVIAARFKFHNSRQLEGETLTQFFARLRSLAKDCNFADLDDALRDRIVCGVAAEFMQRRMLAEPDLTMQKAIDISLGMEAASKYAKELQSQVSGNTTEVANKTEASRTVCFRCNRGSHLAPQCKFRSATCHKCGKVGHIAPACRSMKNEDRDRQKSKQAKSKLRRNKQKQANFVEDADQSQESDSNSDANPIYYIHTLQDADSKIVVQPKVSGVAIKMEVDTGAGRSVMPEVMWKSMFSQLTLSHSNIRLKSYSGDSIKVLGQVMVSVELGDKCDNVPLLVARVDGPALLGRNWLHLLGLKFSNTAATSETKVHKLEVEATPAIKNLIGEFEDVFQPGLGHIQGIQPAKLSIKEDAKPKFFRPRPLPFALKPRVEEELADLIAKDVIEPVSHSDWAAPTVPIVKPTGKIRLCGDYSVTINPVLNVDEHPLPTFPEMMQTLKGGKRFTKLDFAQAYLQLDKDPQSQLLTCINTHKGLYKCKRLQFGIASAPAVFQRSMEEILKGIPGITVFIDDICVTGKNDDEHVANLRMVFESCRKHGVRFGLPKCIFMAPTVDYLGHLLDENGVRPAPSKLDAISKAPAPKKLKELASFLGLINYYRDYIKDLSTIVAPLNALRCKDVTGTGTKSAKKLSIRLKRL